MKFLSITGPKEDIDRVIDTYLSKYEIHLENALSELKTVKDLRPYIEINPYRDTYQRAAELVELLPATAPKTTATAVSIEEAIGTIEKLDATVKELTEKEAVLTGERDSLQESLDKVVPFKGLNY